MVRLQLGLDVPPEPIDAADASPSPSATSSVARAIRGWRQANDARATPARPGGAKDLPAHLLLATAHR
jgi:hypothetical protein